MKIYLPNNIFTRAIARGMPEELGAEPVFLPSSMITKELREEGDNCAFIPTTDLIQNKELFVSKEIGISYEGSLCNTYIYFSKEQPSIDTINIAGDISSIEVILTKILFKEMYNTDVEISLDIKSGTAEGKNVLLTGDENFRGDRYKRGLSFSEEIVETLTFPFVNYVLASKSSELIEKINSYADEISTRVYDELEKNEAGNGITELTAEYIRSNAGSLVIRFEPQDIEGIAQLLRLPYFYGMVDSIIDLKFV